MEMTKGKPMEARLKNPVDAVVGTSSIEFGKELQKQVEAIAREASKSKVLDRKERSDRRMTELTRIKEILMFQEVLNSLGLEDVRSHFENGMHGAPVLTRETLNQLDELYKLITPSREVDPGRPSYEKQLAAAAEHLVGLLNGKNQEVVGTTYKALKVMLKKIHSCDYFKNMKGNCTAGANSNPVNIPPHSTGVGQQSILQQFVMNQATLRPISHMVTHFSDDPFALIPPPPPSDGSIFSTFPHNPPMRSSMPMSGFNFLQESQVDLDSPHMDPAVVSAQLLIPSVPCPLAFSDGHYTIAANPQVRGCSPMSLQTENTVNLQNALGTSDAQPTEYRPSIPTQTFINHKLISLPTVTSPSANYQDESECNPAIHVLPNQTASPAVPELHSQPEIQQQIPPEPKKHFMNVNASAFQSANFKTMAQNNSESTLQTQTVYHGDQSNGEYLDDRRQNVESNVRQHNNIQAPGGYPHQENNSSYHGRGLYHSRSGYRSAGNLRRGAGGNLNRCATRLPGTGCSNGQSDGYGYQSYYDGNVGGGVSNYYQNDLQMDGGYNDYARILPQPVSGGRNRGSVRGTRNSDVPRGNRGGL